MSDAPGHDTRYDKSTRIGLGMILAGIAIYTSSASSWTTMRGILTIPKSLSLTFNLPRGGQNLGHAAM